MRYIPKEEPDIEVFSLTTEVPFVLLFRDLAAWDSTTISAKFSGEIWRTSAP
jgi:hypothetical protein